jgi:formylmethanofuran dehydrogenase subunit B
MWQLAKHKPRQQADSPNGSATHTPNTSVIAGVVHELRQIFTSILLGLGLINKKAKAGNTEAIPRLVRRLNAVVRRGIHAVDILEPSGSDNGEEREYGA